MTIQQLHREFLQSGGICTDTRKEVRGRLFFALRGERYDGNAYVPDALAKGCRLAVTERRDPEDPNRVVAVGSVLETLQQLAAYHRRQSGATFLAITGSNGKTTTKELLAHILARKHSVLATGGNLNNHIGVPLTLLSMKDEQMAIIEMGANRGGEIGLLSQIADPEYGLITNVGKAHLGGFGSVQGVLEAKGELYDYLAAHGGTAFVDGGDSLLKERAGGSGVKTCLIGEGGEVPVSGRILGQAPYLEVELRIAGRPARVNTRLVGAYNLQNIILAAGVGHYFGIPDADIREAVSGYLPANQRSQLIEGGSNSVVMDAYNANPTSMRGAIEGFLEYAPVPSMLILGDMAELGEYSLREHKELAGWAASLPVDRLILVGEQMSRSTEQSSRVLTFRDRPSVERYLQEQRPSGYHILVKASRFMGLEKLLPLLAG